MGVVVSNTQQPNAAQKRWRETVAGFGCVATHADPAHCQIHHVVGRTGKHNRVPIGHWFILPLHWRLHDIHSDDKHNVTHYRLAFCRKYGSQRRLFIAMCVALLATGHALPFEMDVLNAIADTKY